MEHILKNWGSFTRFIIGIIVIFLLAQAFINKLADNTQFNVDYTNDKTLITLIDKKNVIANSVLPACDCWTKTGIEIRPEEDYEIKVSGKIHTTADKMIKDAEDDVKPRYAWVGPEGGNFLIRHGSEYKLTDSIRKTMLLSQTANIGQVLFYFQRKNARKPNCNIKEDYFNPDSVLIYNSEIGISGKNDSKETWLVWATVNDMLITDFQNESTKIAFLGASKGDTLKTKLQSWQTISKENYNRIWFDDNFGSFVISAKISKPTHFFDFW
jgi:hypothetical protein